VTFTDPAWLAEERQCLAALRRGDRRAFDRLFEVYARPLYRRVLLPRLGDPSAAEDALAETFRKAFERLDSYRDLGKGLWPYLATVATNQAHDAHREQARRGRVLSSFASLLAPLEQSAGVESDGTHLRVAIDRVLASVNPRYRRAIELRFLDDRSREDCARLMDVKLGTFDVLLLRALRAFRQQWHELIGERPESIP
jgi:RNA polymerase sigma-70 factor (ECF subfamily)